MGCVAGQRSEEAYAPPGLPDGEELYECPRRWCHDPLLAVGFRAAEWKRAGQLATRFPHPTVKLLSLIEVIEAEYQTVDAEERTVLEAKMAASAAQEEDLLG